MTKYKAIKTEVDGITFDSKKEAMRYRELKILEKAGEITDLRRQVAFELIPKNEYGRAVKYVCDFVYNENGQQIVEDVKGVKTPVYRLKKRLFIERYHMPIRET